MVTLLFTDIESSTRLWESAPAEMAAALARHDVIVRAACEAAGGYVFKTVGDAFCVAFDTPVAALDGAVSAQRLLYSEPWPAQTPIRSRMALHTGTCNERDGDYFGTTVNRTARLEAIAHGGQTLVSRATADALQITAAAETTLLDLGEHRLKDLTDPEHVYQVVIAGLPAAFPPLRSLGNPAFQHNLPRYATTFVGRARELQEIGSLLRGGRLVTLLGPGGSGKTRLAVQASAEALDGSGDGVWLVELASATGPSVTDRVASVLKIAAAPGQTIEETLIDALASRSLLLVLDNCEHVIDAAAILAERFLARCGTVALLATSQEPLGVPGEQVVRVGPLPVPDPTRKGTDPGEADAVQLFADRARARRPDFVVTAANAETITTICARLDGMPLAIELAAAALGSFSLNDIAGQLDDRFALLSAGRRGSVARHQTLRDVVDWSYNLLDAVEQRAFARCSVFSGGWELDAADAVLATTADGRSTVRVLRAFVDKSLVEPVDDGSGTLRYDMLETIRAYSTERLLEADAEQARSAHRRYYATFAETAAPHLTGVNQVAWLDRLDAEAANLRVALDDCVRVADFDTGRRLVNALIEYWMRRGHAATALDSVRRIVDPVQPTNRPPRATRSARSACSK